MSTNETTYRVTVHCGGETYGPYRVPARDEGQARTRAMKAAGDDGLRAMGREVTYTVEAE